MRAALHFLKSGLPWALGLALAMQFVEYFGWVAGPEGKLLDVFLSSGSRAADPKPPLFVTIEIDDKDYENCFIYSPMDPRGINSIVRSVVSAAPKVIGVDIITDSPQKEDEAKYENLPKADNIVWAAGAQRSTLDEPQTFWDWITGPQPLAVQPTRVLGKDIDRANVKWALPVYPRDEDWHVRRLPRRMIVPGGKEKPSWATTIAQLYRGLPEEAGESGPEEIFLARIPQTIKPYKLSDLFTCTPRQRGQIDIVEKPDAIEDFRHSANGGIVLIGGTFANARDYYPTWQGMTSGLRINVNAIAAELAGSLITEIKPFPRLVCDLLIGMLIFAVFDFPWKSRSLNLRIAASLGGIGFALLLAAIVLYWRNLVWFSIVGIAIGMVLHVFVEIWKEDLQIEHEQHETAEHH
jgi:hypothetical protein